MSGLREALARAVNSASRHATAFAATIAARKARAELLAAQLAAIRSGGRRRRKGVKRRIYTPSRPSGIDWSRVRHSVPSDGATPYDVARIERAIAKRAGKAPMARSA